MDAPDERSTLNLSVVLPAGLTLVASGTRLPPQHAAQWHRRARVASDPTDA